MNGPSDNILKSNASVTCFYCLLSLPNALAHIENLQHSSQTTLCSVRAWRETEIEKMFLVFFSFALCEWNMPLKHLPCFSSKKIQLNIPLYPYTSQFHSWKQCFMIIKFRCAVWLHAFERPTACDLMLQTFGWVKGNMVSHKMLINVDGAYNKDLGIRNLNMFPGLNMADVLLQKKHI